MRKGVASGADAAGREKSHSVRIRTEWGRKPPKRPHLVRYRIGWGFGDPVGGCGGFSGIHIDAALRENGEVRTHAR